MAAKLRLGILGAARHVPFSILEPLQKNPDLAAMIEVASIAGKEQDEAAEFAKKWGLPRFHSSPEELLADTSIDCVYIVLPSAMRAQWTVSALVAGKHVLCETPIATNAREALVLQRAAEDAGRVLLSGSHPLHHPMTRRLREMILEGKVGHLERIDMDLPVAMSIEGGTVCTKLGATMGLGNYCIGLIRALTNEEPRVIKAKATTGRDNTEVDSGMECDLALPGGAQAHFSCSVEKAGNQASISLTGSNGMIQAKEWFSGKGKVANTIRVDTFDSCGDTSVETLNNPFPDARDTFYYQLMAFANEVKSQVQGSSIGMPWQYTQNQNTPTDAVRSMAVVDAVYSSAGLLPRLTTFPPPAPYDRIGASKL